MSSKPQKTETDIAMIQANTSWKETRKAETEWVRAAKARPPEEWLAAIESIKDEEARTHAACIVWWDWFGGRPATKRWSHLDQYMTQWETITTPIASSRVTQALCIAGYPVRLAEKRVKETQ